MKLRRRRWGKLLALVLLAVVAGTGLGVGIAVLSRQTDDPASTGTQAEKPGGPSTNATAPPGGMHVRVLGARLHLAETESGRERRRARLAVRVRAENRGERPVTPARPTLLVAGTRVRTDPNADAPRTHLGEVPAGESVAVTLRFETAGDVTTTLARERRARVVIAGQTLPVRVMVAAADADAAPAETAGP